MPLKKIDPVNIKKIIPGFYNYEKVGGVAVVRPNENPADYWILSKVTRQIFMSKHRAIIVPIDFKEEQNESAAQSDPEMGECVSESAE